ncbi:TrmB family transcriptional regulator [Candidatus Woesearchaeota archaeon]|nr:TrmB family transcriptional regulator [Candidatus Woesearchaeota archaeon]
MIVKDEFIKKLRAAFDLNIYEVKIWTALLSKGIATAGELSDMSNVPRSRSYDVLESLEKKGFIMVKLGKPIKYMAIKPENIVKRVKDRIKEKVDERIKNLENVRTTEAYGELQTLYTQGIENIDVNELSGAMRGRTNIHSQLSAMLNKAKDSIIIMTTEKGLVRKKDLLLSAGKKLKARKVRIRIAAPISSETARRVAEDLKNVAEFRSVDKINARFCLIDGKEMLFMVLDDNKVHESYDTAIWVDSPFFTSALENMFNLSWNSTKKA